MASRFQCRFPGITINFMLHAGRTSTLLRLEKWHPGSFLRTIRGLMPIGGADRLFAEQMATNSDHRKPHSNSRSKERLMSRKGVLGYMAGVLELCDKGHLHDAVKILGFMQKNKNLDLDPILFRRLLQNCIKQKDLEAGRKVHSLLTSSGLALNTVLGNHLIRLFSTCGNLTEANEIFCSLPEPDIQSWAAIMAAHTKNGEPAEAMRLYAEMQKSSVRPNEYVYVAALKACSIVAALQRGRKIHSDIANAGYDSNLYVGAALIDMYSKCGSTDDAINVFKKLSNPDVVCWNALISGLAQTGLGQQAFRFFITMQKEGMKPNHLTFVSILKACIKTRDVFQGRLIHSQIINSGFGSNVFVGSALIDMYAKCGTMEEASKVFQNLPEKNLVTWNAMVAGYAEHDLGRSALQLFEQMKRDRIRPDSFTFVSALQACGGMLALAEGKKIHSQIDELELEVDAFTGSALIDMYSKCGDLQEAENVFNKLHKKSIVVWNSMIAAYVRHGLFAQALAVFNKMEQEGSMPDNVTFMSALRACSSIPALEQGKLIHTRIIQSGLGSDPCVGSALVDMYGKCASLIEALEVFNKMPERDVVTWNALITGAVQHGFDTKALDLYNSMQIEGVVPDKITMVTILKACGRLASLDDGKAIHSCIVSHGLELDEVVGSNLVDMYVKCGSLELACQVFDRLPRRNVLAWNAMIKGYATHGDDQLSLNYFDKMQMEGTKCDGVTYVSILKICSNLEAIDAGKRVHEQIIQEGFELDLFVGNSLIDMYVKCGCIKKATEVFDNLVEKDVVSWSIIIGGYTQQELYHNALHLFERMLQEGIEPTDITYVSVLRCCGSIVARNQGKQIHKCLIERGSPLDSFVGNALVDMYAKCGSLTEAHEVFNVLPVRNVQSWNALLSGYAHHGLGQHAIQHFQIMQHEGTKPDDVTLLSILSACSHANLLDEGFHIFHSVLEGIKELIGKQHYACMVDLLSRAGNLCDAENLIGKLKLPPNSVLQSSMDQPISTTCYNSSG